MYQYKIDLEEMILKPNMVITGRQSVVQNIIDEVAETTLKCLLSSVSATMPTVAFLSGGQPSEDAM